MTEDEMVGWHHRLNGHEFEQAPRVGDGQGGLVYYSPWGRKELDTTELNCPNHSQGERRMSTSLHQGYVTGLHLTPWSRGRGTRVTMWALMKEPRETLRFQTECGAGRAGCAASGQVANKSAPELMLSVPRPMMSAFIMHTGTAYHLTSWKMGRLGVKKQFPELKYNYSLASTLRTPSPSPLHAKAQSCVLSGQNLPDSILDSYAHLSQGWAAWGPLRNSCSSMSQCPEPR